MRKWTTISSKEGKIEDQRSLYDII